MNPYPWAANSLKLTLAISDVKASGAEVTEEAVKAAYVKRNGLVIGGNTETNNTVGVIDGSVATTAMETSPEGSVETETKEEVKPKRRRASKE